MRKEGDSLEKIARIVGKTSEEVQATIEKRAGYGMITAN